MKRAGGLSRPAQGLNLLGCCSQNLKAVSPTPGSGERGPPAQAPSVPPPPPHVPGRMARAASHVTTRPPAIGLGLGHGPQSPPRHAGPPASAPPSAAQATVRTGHPGPAPLALCPPPPGPIPDTSWMTGRIHIRPEPGRAGQGRSGCPDKVRPDG